MANTLKPDSPCLCGSERDSKKRSYSNCCQPLHLGQPAANAEALMRSRFTAFALNLTDYLLASWHSSTRPLHLDGDDDCQWLSLEILDSQTDEGADQQYAWVRFRALFCQENSQGEKSWGVLSENSRFAQEQGFWRYLDGEADFAEFKPGRNDSCPCGSGKKFKKCCNSN